jgi:2,3-bisphosphoglycerate-independent phosphoglycerate mutase
MEKVRPAVLIILDGFGVNPDSRFNAIANAKTPTLDRIFKTYPHGQLDASESHVGLPGGFMGNSEVGHLNIGAGRIVYQDFSLISRAIEDESFFKNKAFLELFEKLKGKGGGHTLHLMGLVSDGGVHSHISHLFALIRLAKSQGIKRIAIHAFTDGRDTSPTSGIQFLRTLASFCSDAGAGEVATVIGRSFAMDRDNRWERTEKAYDAIVSGTAENVFSDPVEYLTYSYEEKFTDEFVQPAVAKNYAGIEDGDGVIFFNFRADRARQLTRAMTQTDFSQFRRSTFPGLSGFVMMTRYDESFSLPIAFEKTKVQNTLGEVVSSKGWKQLRAAETEKYAHVTYFFNGGVEKAFNGEKRVLIPSPREVPTYDLKPEMSARELADTFLKELKSGEYQFAVINFANPDMVGHTGNFPAAVRAVETVDGCLKGILDWVENSGGFAILTADHGNCEIMQAPDGTPLTSHTLQPVPFVVIDPKHTKDLEIASGGRLCDIAPTILDLWDVSIPKDMTGKSLLRRI